VCDPVSQTRGPSAATPPRRVHRHFHQTGRRQVPVSRADAVDTVLLHQAADCRPLILHSITSKVVLVLQQKGRLLALWRLRRAARQQNSPSYTQTGGFLILRGLSGLAARPI